MLIKSVLALAVALTLAAVQEGITTKFIQFTHPVGVSESYHGGENTTFSWIGSCVAPNTKISATPSHTEIQLFDATDVSASFFLETIGYIDCSGADGLKSGNPSWVVPVAYADPSSSYALRIAVSPWAYSGTFKILGLYPQSSPFSTTPTTSFPSREPTNKVSSDETISNGGNGLESTGEMIGIAIVVLAVLVGVVYIIWKICVNKKRSWPGDDKSELDAVPKLDGDLKELTTRHEALVSMEEQGGNLTLGSAPQLQQQQYIVAEEQSQCEKQEEDEIRRETQELQPQFEHSQRQQHHQLEGLSWPSMAVGSCMPATFMPPVVDHHLYGSQRQFREELQLSSHPRPNVVVTLH